MSATNIHEELLALLDRDQAASCTSSVPPLPPRHQLSRRGGGGNPSQQLFADVPISASTSSDRSVPQTFKYWAGNTRAGNASCTKKRSQKNKYSPSDDARGGIGRNKLLNSSRHIGRSRVLSGPVIVLQYFALVSIGACTYFYSKMLISNSGGQTESFYGKAASDKLLLPSGGAFHEDWGALPQSSFIDPLWRGKEEAQFETLVRPSEIDFALQRRLRVGEEKKCDDILLYLPRVSSSTSYAEQEQVIRNELNDYFLAALLATSMGKAMVILENPITRGSNNGNINWFECPVDTFSRSEQQNRDFPTGLSRLIRHPHWLSRSCPV